MTAADLYECDPGFRGFLAVWVEARRCPLELVDYLLDRDMEGPAECARWAATEPTRHTCVTKDDTSYPYPGEEKGNHWWYRSDAYQKPQFARDVPAGLIARHVTRDDVSDLTAAIVVLMDAWVVPSVACIDTGGILRG